MAIALSSNDPEQNLDGRFVSKPHTSGLGIECHFVDKKFSVLTFEHRYYDIKKNSSSLHN
ncbi:hypothetical protein T02_3176 [Trichinella nativa]|uniref:Uncharacterized protein n=1 Tax=Trichinella nativa TaxID=6335 RepID=A0A0V1KTA5_9BILA|nr:hypothetical protein T02_3176 [Trichinella nativa]